MGSSPAIPARASEESCSIPRLLSSFPNRTHCVGLRFGRRGSPFLFGSKTIRSLLRRFAPVAQEVEHLPFKQGVRGSSPRWSTKKKQPQGCFFWCPAGTRIIIEAAGGGFIRQSADWRIPLFAPISREAQMQRVIRWSSIQNEPRTPKRAAFFERSGSTKPPEGLFIKNMPLNIDFSRGLAYNGVAERQCIEDVHYLHRRTNPLGEPPPRGFFRFYGPDGLPAGFAALLSIKPFANVICHNTCQDGEDKHFEDVHRPFTSLTARCRQRSDYNIWFFVFQCKERPKYK